MNPYRLFDFCPHQLFSSLWKQAFLNKPFCQVQVFYIPKSTADINALILWHEYQDLLGLWSTFGLIPTGFCFHSASGQHEMSWVSGRFPSWVNKWWCEKLLKNEAFHALILIASLLWFYMNIKVGKFDFSLETFQERHSVIYHLIFLHLLKEKVIKWSGSPVNSGWTLFMPLFTPLLGKIRCFLRGVEAGTEHLTPVVFSVHELT